MGEVTKTTKKTPKKAKKVVTVDSVQTINQILDRIRVLERQNKLIIEGDQFVGNETRNLFGFGAIAQIFDAIYEKLTK